MRYMLSSCRFPVAYWLTIWDTECHIIATLLYSSDNIMLSPYQVQLECECGQIDPDDKD